MQTKGDIKRKSLVGFIAIVAAVILLAMLSSFLRIRLDLTEDKRFTLSKQSHEILSDLKNDIYIQVWLDGDMPVEFKKLRRSVRELLDEFRILSGKRIDFEFINPSAAGDVAQREAQYTSLIGKGLNPINIQSGDEEGGSSQKIIFPGMLVNYNGTEVPVNFLSNNPTVSPEQNLLHSIEGLEYEMIQTIATLSADTIYKIAFIEGHDEYSEIETGDLTLNLARFFTIDRGIIGGKPGILDDYTAIIIAGPEKEFTENDKFVIDQYIMNGGKVLWLLEEVYVNSDSLTLGRSTSIYRPLNLDDQLFRYGVRLNPIMVQDLDCSLIPLTVITGESNRQVVPAPWPWYPLLQPSSAHPVTRNLNKIRAQFTNYLDTVGLDPQIKKTVLLSTSPLTRLISPPAEISLEEAAVAPDERTFTRGRLPVAVLLEGVFPSAFRNRITDNLAGGSNIRVRNESDPTQMIVIADGDVIRNDIMRSGTSEAPYPLGQDRYTGQMFGNRDFLINCLNYLADDKGLLELRSREMKMRLLNRTKIRQEKTKWQVINVAGPVVVVILYGLAYSFFRKRKYAKSRV